MPLTTTGGDEPASDEESGIKKTLPRQRHLV